MNRDVEELGAKVLHQWATLGEYDFVNIVEAPDAATVAKISLALGARGSAKLQSLELVDDRDAARRRSTAELARGTVKGRFAAQRNPGSREAAGAGSAAGPASGRRSLYSFGATSFGASAWKSEARCWIWPRPGPSSNWPPP